MKTGPYVPSHHAQRIIRLGRNRRRRALDFSTRQSFFCEVVAGFVPPVSERAFYHLDEREGTSGPAAAWVCQGLVGGRAGPPASGEHLPRSCRLRWDRPDQARAAWGFLWRRRLGGSLVGKRGAVQESQE